MVAATRPLRFVAHQVRANDVAAVLRVVLRHAVHLGLHFVLVGCDVLGVGVRVKRQPAMDAIQRFAVGFFLPGVARLSLHGQIRIDRHASADESFGALAEYLLALTFDQHVGDFERGALDQGLHRLLFKIVLSLMRLALAQRACNAFAQAVHALERTHATGKLIVEVRQLALGHTIDLNLERDVLAAQRLVGVVRRDAGLV